ncbi:MAG: hypothetical protein M3Y22_01490 [Pseudomonadota bacterium]|nr:hypothetical protein [Pseudomonadota bacterium]
MDDQIIDRAMARSLHDDACRSHTLVAWIVMADPPDHSGKFTARLSTGSHTPYLLLADTLAAIHAALPPCLELSPRQPADLPEVVEIWFSR